MVSSEPPKYEIVEPDEDIAAFVRRHMYVDSAEFVRADIRPVPTAYSFVGHIFGREIFDVVSGSKHHSQSGFHFSSQVDERDRVLHYEGHIGSAMTELRPTAAFRLFGIRLGDLQYVTEDMYDVLDRDRADRYAAHLLNAKNRHERLAGLNAGIREFISETRDRVPQVDDAVDLIEKRGGQITVAEVCETLDAPVRNFSRHFRSITGLTPKFFARATQINIVTNLLFHGDQDSLTELAQDCGFYDQSHFIKTIQSFFEMGPSEFLNGEHHMFRTFIAESRSLRD